MVVVILTAGGALLLLRAYNSLPDVDAPEGAIASIQQGTAVLAALCAATFAIITALRTGKPPGFSSMSATATAVPTTFGRPASLGSGVTT